MRFRYLIFSAALVVLIIAWTTSNRLGQFGWTFATAQVIALKPVPERVMTGDDIGFKVVGLRGETPVGHFVVRVNGKWVDAEVATSPTVRPSSQ